MLKRYVFSAVLNLYLEVQCLISNGSEFQIEELENENDLSPVDLLVLGTIKVFESLDDLSVLLGV